MYIKTSLLLLFVIGFQLLYSQNYRCFDPTRKALYKDTNNNIIGLRFDSTTFNNNDSILYPFKNIILTGNNCYSVNKYSWIGEKIIEEPSGSTFFFNQKNDSILIKTKAALNDSWTLFNANGYLINATIDKIYTDELFNTTDSIKEIKLTIVAFKDSTIKKSIDTVLLLSKQHGLIRTTDFVYFPYLSFLKTYNNESNIFALIGLTNPAIGVQNLDSNGIYDLQPGDELDIEYRQSSYGGIVTNRDVKSILKILDKSLNVSYISLIHEINTNDYNTNTWVVDTTYYTTGTYLMQKDNIPQFSNLPNEVNYYQGAASESGKFYISDSLFIRSTESNNPSVYQALDTCWELFLIVKKAEPPYVYNYYKGLGGPYYSYWDGQPYGYIEGQELVYYKKGNKTWGTPFIFVSTNDIKQTPQTFLIFPNPASSQLTIQAQSTKRIAKVEITNTLGQNVLEQSINSTNPEFRINIENIPGGFYFIHLLSSDGTAFTQKIIIK